MAKDILKPIYCKKCNAVMQWQISEIEAILHCQPCRRAIVVSDWHSDAKLLAEKPSND